MDLTKEWINKHQKKLQEALERTPYEFDRGYLIGQMNLLRLIRKELEK